MSSIGIGHWLGKWPSFQSLSSYWTPQSLVVEDSAPTHVVMTGLVANTNLVAGDFTIGGIIAVFSSISRSVDNKTITGVLNISVIPENVITITLKDKVYQVTNNVTGLTVPSLQTPADTSIIIDPAGSIVFHWHNGNNALLARLQVATDLTFTNLIIDEDIVQGGTYSGTENRMPDAQNYLADFLLYNTTYYWRVNNTTIYGTGDWETARSFTTIAEPTDADATAFLTATGIIDATIISAVNRHVLGLKADGLWVKAFCIYPLVGGADATHKFNLKNPLDSDGGYRLSYSGTIVHNSNGMTGNGTDGYANTHFVPSVAMTLDHTHSALYIRNNINAAAMDFGVDSDAVRYFGFCGANSGSCMNQMYGTGTTTDELDSAVTDSIGCFVNSRTSSTKLVTFKNGVKIGELAGTRIRALPTSAILLMARDYFGTPGWFSHRNQAYYSFGSDFSDFECWREAVQINKFQTWLGRNVYTNI